MLVRKYSSKHEGGREERGRANKERESERNNGGEEKVRLPQVSIMCILMIPNKSHFPVGSFHNLINQLTS